jgi:hypothetical protein
MDRRDFFAIVLFPLAGSGLNPLLELAEQNYNQ